MRGTSAARLGKLVLFLVAAGLAVLHVRLAWLAEFGLDEYQYAHGGWLIAQGGTIYVDFFEHHFPFLHQLLGVVWKVLGDDPTQLLTLRMLFLPVFGLVVVGGCLVNHSRETSTAWWTAPVLLSIPTLSAMATQLRPDVLALALFFSSLALLRTAAAGGVRRRRLSAALAGVLAVAALWSTQKAAIYAGIPFLAALAADWLTWRTPSDQDNDNDNDDNDNDNDDRYLLGHPVAFVAGSAATALLILISLLVTGSLGAWWHWAVDFSLAHQEVYPGFGWTRNFFQLLDHSVWLLPLSALGIVITIRDRPKANDTDWLLLAAVPSTAASFIWQAAPYLYSLIPLSALMGLFAARGLAWCWQRCLAGQRVFVTALLLLLLAGELHQTTNALKRLEQPSNATQLATLAHLGRMTAPGDVVFSPWAMQVARPSPHFFHFLEAATQRLEAERLQRELLPAVQMSGVTVFLHHDLAKRLPPAVWSYLQTHFLPYDQDLWVYGSRYPVHNGTVEGDFFAVKEGVYFVSPPDALGGEQVLRIDGIALEAPILRLGLGPHHVEYRGDAEDVSIVWMPRDGRPFVPRPAGDNGQPFVPPIRR